MELEREDREECKNGFYVYLRVPTYSSVIKVCFKVYNISIKVSSEISEYVDFNEKDRKWKT